MLDIKKLRAGYGERMIIDDLTFEARPGEITAIMGPNGVGKTTLLKAIFGLIRYEGEIVKSGKISFLNQDVMDDNSFTVFETVLMGKVKDLSLKVTDGDIYETEKMLDLVKIRDLEEKRLCQLSSGQRQKVLICQALMKNPDILLLDEPTSNLDIKNQYQIMDLISELTRERGLISLISIHQIDLIERYSDRILILKGGRLYDFGDKDQVFSEKMFQEVYGIKSQLIKKENRILFSFDI